MGVSGKSANVFSHSAITEMSAIKQEEPRSSSGARMSGFGGGNRGRKSRFDADYDDDDDGFEDLGRNRGRDDDDGGFGGFGDSKGYVEATCRLFG